MSIVHVHSLSDLNSRVQSADANRLFIVDFYADWCGPCKRIEPYFEQLSDQYPNATFCKVNVDNSRDIMQQYGVQAMPTFVFIKNKVEVDRVQGSDPNKLHFSIKRFYSDIPANPNAATPSEKAFLEQFTRQSKTRYWDDLIYKTLALSVIPVEAIQEAATVDGKVNMFLLAKELLDWFKNKFFTWCDSPKCPDCGKQTPKGSGLHGTVTDAEKACEASRVEIYVCECGQEVRFPRYNDPAKLLETRTGRCGEWANCFALVAAAMQFDVRYIYDVTDHVWVELWIPEMDRWVHCDPCENIIDSPLVYEKGWGKKLSYVIAFGSDHVYDVTWRYADKIKATLKRRNMVREPVLLNYITKLNARIQKNCGTTEERIVELRRRRQMELIDFCVIGKRPETGDKYGGRITGDVSWRAARGELGGSPKKKQIVLRPNDQELDSKKFSLEYNCAKDIYRRAGVELKNWSSCIFKSKNVKRKVESDWNMAYLCRKEGTDEAEVTWAIDLSGVSAKMAKLKISGAEVFESGRIQLTACADDVCMVIPSSGELVLNDLPSTLLKITANFSGGSGSNAFQHAQLFRTPSDSLTPQLSIEIDFN